MSLTTPLTRAFRPAIRARGASYARGKRVMIETIEANRVRARVRGSGRSPYRVEIRVARKRSGGGVSFELDCSCPYAEGGDPCKHLWATLCALDARDWEPALLAGEQSATGARAAHDDAEDFEVSEPFILDEDDDPYEDDDYDEDLDDELDPKPSRRTGGWQPNPDALRVFRELEQRLNAAQRPPGRPGWRARLDQLASRAKLARQGVVPLGGPHRLAPAPAPTPLFYLLDPEEIAREQRVQLRFARRARGRDGEPGALRLAQIGPGESAAAAIPEEAAALAQLIALAEAERRGPYRHSYASVGSLAVSALEVPLGLARSLLPQLAGTQRLGLLARTSESQGRGTSAGADASREEPRWLRFDPGAAWELRLTLAPASLAESGKGGALLHGRFARGGESLALEQVQLVLACGLLVCGEALARCELAGAASSLSELARGPLRIPASGLDLAVERLASLPGLPPLELGAGIAWTQAAGHPQPRLRFEGLDESRRAIPAQIDFRYGGVWVPADWEAPNAADRRARVLFARNLEAEGQALGTLAALGFQSADFGDFPINGGRELARSGVKVPRARFEAAAEELLAKGWQLEAEGARLRRPGASTAVVRSGLDFFELEGAVDFEGERVPFPALLAAAAKQRLVRLGDGSLGLLPRVWLQRCERMLGAAEEVETEDGAALRFARAQLGLIDALLAVQDEAKSDAHFDELRAALADFRGIEPAREPAGFRGELRAYQREGLGWLHFLRRFGLGGCLADDMGLGKTVQVLALIAGTALEPGPQATSARGGGKREQKAAAAAPRPWLVVAPKSVVHGWISEAQRFAPELRVLRYSGAERAALRERIAESQLVVTSYGTLLRDTEWFSEQHFDTVVLDEAQAIKNAAAKTARTARALRASHRLALTGTPVENHLGELASLLEFLNPGMLGRARGLSALAQGRGDAADLELLSRALRPLLLRRTKRQVLRELPERSEQTLVCELEASERREYDELRRHFQAKLGRRIERDGLARSKIHVLEALLRLRQAACHPALIDPKRAGDSSAKLGVLFEQLEEVLEEGHKALIFSQFTRFLALVRTGLAKREIPYAYLDGRTRDRAERIAQFQEDPDCRVFAISLRAGGTGLNLTAADYVFLLDPWWNPAVEAQAVDRAHRIGQTRPVMAYRLVAKDTVEEKILQLQQSKRELAASVLGDEKSFLGQLSSEDLKQLLE